VIHERLPLAAAACVWAAVALGAGGCDREPVRTVVLKPSAGVASQPGAAMPPPPVAAAPVPAASAPVAPSTASANQPQPPAPKAATVAAPRAQAPAPVPVAVRNIGDPEGARLLADRKLIVPVAGVPPASLMDGYEQRRSEGRHEAIDIAAPTGTRVLAVDDGTVAKLFTSVPGGLTLYQFDPSGQLAYYYAHLDRYAEGLKEGMPLKRGDLVGYVGTTGNSPKDAPHLHFAVFRLGPEKQWWKGEAVNPYPALRNATG
jgi:murein DD-endopeptidase MepM/ murein hydrolase activator NlpD